MSPAVQMTPEEQRERLLKRALPALVITVVYVTFVSGGVSERAEEAEKEYLAIASKGVSEAALPGMTRQQQQLEEEIRRLEEEHRTIHENLEKFTGRLGRQDNAVKSIETLSSILAKHGLRILEEQRENRVAEAQITRAARDIRHWLKESAEADDELTVWRIRFIGGYADTYRALSTLTAEGFVAVPLSLTMQEPEAGEAERPGELAWTLLVWI